MKYTDVTSYLEKQKTKKLQTVDQTDGRIRVSNYMDRVKYGFIDESEVQDQYNQLIKQYTLQLVKQWVAELKQTVNNSKTMANASGLQIAQLKHDYNHS